MTQSLYTMDAETGRIAPAVDEAQARAWDHDHVMTTYARLPVTLVRGEGAKVWDANGKEYLDFLAGIAVNGVGHCHPRVVRAIQEQAATLIHASNLYLTEPQARLAAKLVSISDFERVFFCNSGAEANEAAIKIARKHGKKNGSATKFGIVTANRSFHGRTLATVTATAQPKYQTPFAPVVPGFSYVPFNDIEALRAAVSDDTCAVMLEPVQGEGGIYPAHKEFLREARELCDKFGALLIFDEIQTGVGRSGKWWAYEHYGVIPDIMTLAKALGGGVPIGACLARGEAATTLVPGDHGSTFAGNPLAARAALAVLEAIEEEHLLANAHAMGAYFVHRLNEAPLRGKIKEIRALGLLIGVELVAPDARRVLMEALDQGLIINAVGDHILRLLPPLVITKEDVDRAVEILSAII
ncbi:MAG: acetylornithine transaminase [Capsulimonas sp.]|uniref:acetylornithine transaminase n=1 Tax=Capsulimonas sp. TaxID=2494211 RepID=UPI003267A42A